MMTAVPSTMLPLGTVLPEFSLRNVVDGRMVSTAGFRDRQGLLGMFICNHCPHVQHVKQEIGRVAADSAPRGGGVIAISSNDIAAFPDDAPDRMKALALAEGWRFPYLFDETQEAAKAFRAGGTPGVLPFAPQR